MIKHTLAALAILSGPALADAPEIENVNMKREGDTWTFDVTLRHADTGWDHYADAWRVVDMNGKELGLRRLAHPHAEEQPFTRSLSGVRIPPDLAEVGIQASDTLGGWSENVKTIKLR